jgi:hypothetical protein
MDMNEVILSGRVEHEILDQEVAMALYLHRCDSLASVRATLPTLTPDARFSRTHYAYSQRDVNQRIRPVLASQAEASFSLSGSKGYTYGHSVHTVLLQRTLADVASSSGERDRADSVTADNIMNGIGASTSGLSLPKPPHYDILRVALDAHAYAAVGSAGAGLGLGALEELLTIDVSRHDVFESILVFMLVIYFTAHTLAPSSPSGSVASTDSEGHSSGDGISSSPSDDDSIGRKFSSSPTSSASLGGSPDYRVIQPIIEDIAGREELLQLIKSQRTAMQSRMNQQTLIKNQQSAQKIISSGFGFGLGLSYPSPSSGGGLGTGVGRTNVSPHHYHHHLHMPSNLAVSSQIRMPTNHHSPSSTSPTSTMSTSMPSSMFRPNNNLRQSNILPTGGVAHGTGGMMDTGMKKHVDTVSGSAPRKSFRSLLSDSGVSFNNSVMGTSTSVANMHDVSYAQPQHMAAGYMNAANPYASPHY